VVVVSVDRDEPAVLRRGMMDLGMCSEGILRSNARRIARISRIARVESRRSARVVVCRAMVGGYRMWRVYG